MKCIGPRAKDADLWIFNWEEVRRIRQEGVLQEVEHVKAHRSKKEVEEMKLFERFVTEGSERSDEFAKDSNAGRRRHGSEKGQHRSTEKGGGLSGITLLGQLSLFGGGMERL